MAINKTPNFRSADPLKKPFNAQHSTVEDIQKEAIKQMYTPDSLGGTTFYAATVLSVEEFTEVEDPARKSFFANLIGIETTVTIRKYRIYIPEVHAALGEPPDLIKKNVDITAMEPDAQTKYAQGLEKVKSYHLAETFYPTDTNEKYEPGDAVWVFFQNARTMESAFILSRILKNGQPGNNQETSTAPTTTPTAGVPAVANKTENKRIKPSKEVPMKPTKLDAAQALACIKIGWKRITNQDLSDTAWPIILSQWALETGWGKSMYNYNYAGIKDAGQTGEFYNSPTYEGHGASRVRVIQPFCSWPTCEDGAEGYLRLLFKRYQKALEAAANGDPAGYAHELKKAGYYTASEEEYTKNVISISKSAKKAVERATAQASRNTGNRRPA